MNLFYFRFEKRITNIRVHEEVQIKINLKYPTVEIL